MKNNSSSPSERLATLNTRILELEQERTELLRQELANAEQRSQEVASFIGVYNASSGQPGAIPTATRPVSKKRAVRWLSKRSQSGAGFKYDS